MDNHYLLENITPAIYEAKGPCTPSYVVDWMGCGSFFAVIVRRFNTSIRLNRCHNKLTSFGYHNNRKIITSKVIISILMWRIYCTDTNHSCPTFRFTEQSNNRVLKLKLLPSTTTLKFQLCPILLQEWWEV